jgi:hypothetical protein
MEGIAIPLAASVRRMVRRLHGTPAFAGIRVAGNLPLDDCHGVPLVFAPGYPPVQSSESTLN